MFILLALVPVALMAATRILEASRSLAAGSSGEFFAKVMLSLYFQLLIPVLALFFGTSIVNDELDNKTLVYLTTVPVPRRAVLLGKYLAAVLLAALLVVAGFLLCFLAASLTRLGDIAAWEELGLFLGTSLLALFCYSSLFTALGAFMKKSVLLGLFFVFGWESVVQYFPGGHPEVHHHPLGEVAAAHPPGRRRLPDRAAALPGPGVGGRAHRRRPALPASRRIHLQAQGIHPL